MSRPAAEFARTDDGGGVMTASRLGTGCGKSACTVDPGGCGAKPSSNASVTLEHYLAAVHRWETRWDADRFGAACRVRAVGRVGRFAAGRLARAPRFGTALLRADNAGGDGARASARQLGRRSPVARRPAHHLGHRRAGPRTSGWHEAHHALQRLCGGHGAARRHLSAAPAGARPEPARQRADDLARRQRGDGGWLAPVSTPIEAQAAANRGEFVVAVYQNPDPHRPGHIAVLRPSDKSQAALDTEGPQEAQAGERNWLTNSVAEGFLHHHGAWLPGGAGTLRFFAHTVDWSKAG